MIEFDNVEHRYPDGHRVLDGVTLTIHDGEVLVLVGRSGSGKTTILKHINRLLLPTSGEVRLDGTATTAWDPIKLRRRIGYVLQEVGLFPHMTVARNIATVPRLEKWSQKRTEDRIDELLTLVGLEPSTFRGRLPHELSGGQRQRVGVARALATDPPVLLMDEPFGALDPLTRAEIHREFHRIQSQLRKTIVCVTHDMGEAFALGTRMGVIKDGRVAALASPTEIYNSRDEEVRVFLDAMPKANDGTYGKEVTE
jgi:osmoprotectant transport system ATP-binding protein